MLIIETECQMTHAVALIADTQNQKLEAFHAEPKHAQNVVHHYREEDYATFKEGDDLRWLII